MGDRKMNIGEQISAREVREDLRGYSYLKPGRETMVTEGPYYGVKPVPVTLHLEQVYASGLFAYYPQVIGVGGQYGCICYSNGAFTHVLADWIVDLASLPYVEGVDVWMAENLHGLGGCHCAQCSLWDRDVLEANTIVAAWDEAQARLGRYINLWILTSEETYSSNRREVASGCVVALGISTTGTLTPDLTWQTMGSGAGVDILPAMGSRLGLPLRRWAVGNGAGRLAAGRMGPIARHRLTSACGPAPQQRRVRS